MENIIEDNIIIKIQKPTYQGYESLSIFMNNVEIGKMFVKHEHAYPTYDFKNYKIKWVNNYISKYPQLKGSEKGFTNIKGVLEYIKGSLKSEFPESNISIDNGYPKVYYVISDRNSVNLGEEIITEKTHGDYYIGHRRVLFNDKGEYEEHGHGSGFGDLWGHSHYYFLNKDDAKVKFIEEEERVNAKYKGIFTLNYIEKDLREEFPNFIINVSGLKNKQLICKNTIVTNNGFIDSRIIINESEISKCQIEITGRESDFIKLEYKGAYISAKFIKNILENHINDNNFFK